MRQANHYAIVFWLLKNDHDQFLLIQRKNTWYNDWYRALPAGHIELWESATEAFIKEMKEEIDIYPKNYTLFHTVLYIDDMRQYCYLWFVIDKREWTIKNNEPNKCSWVKRYSQDNLPENITYQARNLIQAYQTNTNFSEMDLREVN
jgi:8-oxo-dGTP pyrophosphatase MutT (NUDIX family)